MQVSSYAAPPACYAEFVANLISLHGEVHEVRRVPLLKAIEDASAAAFEAETIDMVPDAALRKQIRAVVLESNMAGIEEFGETWYICIKAKMLRMSLCAEWTLEAMADEACGFDEFERALIAGACRLLPAYHDFYLAYLASVQEPEIIAALKANPPPTSDANLYSSYTIVAAAAGGGFTAVPFAQHFAECLEPVLAGFDTWIAECEAAATAPLSGPWSGADRAAYVAFLRAYRGGLALDADVVTLEAAWTEVDRLWMDCRMPIQLLHDIETGYGDPLRVKATPDLSLRFLDETYADENETIADIQRRMMGYYAGRDTPLARGGLKALGNTMAGIYAIPFKTGISLQFSFSGQSVPNRTEVREEKGVKIYFDAVETAARVAINTGLVRAVFHEADGADGVLARYEPDAVEQLVWHVAAHEVGHAIYNLGCVAHLFTQPAHESLLEEPRAELTAMFTLRLLHEQGVLDRPHLDRALAHFALDALRYFAKYESEALRPYIIFQVYAFKVYGRTGYLAAHPASGKLVLDASKTLEVLNIFSSTFLLILDAMDAANGAALEHILFEELAPEDAFVRATVAAVGAAPGQAGGARPERGCTCHPSWRLPQCPGLVCQPCD